ncbi:hypothetical protein Mhun_0718 [Methanospirillum hungatei JF-1]|uniref:Uncharacterized protein n=2 Tax=Methanospirillum hungatei TaxID=2203 RepID=Q2FQ20_METHJ|nr:hypothetical protein Mhun_0718 [Methanospirillum hungatei JF-1]
MTMTTPPHNIQEFNISNLDEDWKLATVYAAFISPKTPQQALKLIYHGATTGVSENWVINTRRKLIEMGYITKVDDEDSNTLYKSDMGPIANLILSHQKDNFFKEKGTNKIHVRQLCRLIQILRHNFSIIRITLYVLS